jgi:predicted ABC-type ATPase
MPHLIIVARSNGSGKSTSAPALLQDALHVDNFVNADIIAQGLCAYQPEKTMGTKIAAGCLSAM